MSFSAEPAESKDDGQDQRFAKAKGEALRLLTYRARSQAEVRRRLAKRYSGEVIERVIVELLGQRLLDDAAFALEWRQQREPARVTGFAT